MAMISVEEALVRILRHITALPVVSVPLAESLGLILAKDIAAQENIPPFDNSAMDGFALRSQDSRQRNGQPARLRITGEVAAGYVSQQSVQPGTAMRIMTGAPVPTGADAVVQVEMTHTITIPASLSPTGQEEVEILKEVPEGKNIRRAGEDMQPGQIILTAGTEIGPWEIGMLATLGQDRVPVVRRARVAILGTGDEIIDIDQPLQPGKIRNSNSYLVEAAVRRAGAEPVLLGVAKDTIESLREKFARAITCDLIVTTGGVSVGEFDLVKQVMQEEGEMEFWRINMRPGKPVAFGHIGQIPLIGLPGNPVSTAVTFELFVRPAIRKMQGHQRIVKPQVPVTIEQGAIEPIERRHYMRAHVQWQDGRFVARTTGKQGSHIMTSLSAANALVIVPESGVAAPANGQTMALMLDWPEVELPPELQQAITAGNQ